MQPGLTLTLGLRWEYFSPIAEARNRLTNLVLAAPYTLLGARVESLGQLFHRDRNNFGPRAGFAYNPSAWKKLVVRGGFGIYYERQPNVIFANSRGNPPLLARYSLCCGTAATPFDNGQIQYALGAGNSIYGYPANPALAVGIDPLCGAVAESNRGSVGLGAELSYGIRAIVYSWNLEYAPPLVAWSLPQAIRAAQTTT